MTVPHSALRVPRSALGADLFCGAGGTSTGYVRACLALGLTPELFALNHNPVAVQTHELNHPGVRHLCEEIDRVRPREAIPGGRLDLLCASPECTHFSLAAGGRPRNDQSRAQAWQILRWATDLAIDNILIENVREFQNWGPLNKTGRPTKRKRGQYFAAFITGLRNLGYTVEHRILCAADYGDPTTRQRLFIIARKHRKIEWPEPTHRKVGLAVLSEPPGAHGVTRPTLKAWRPAREIIDWDLKGQSIFRRKRPLSANTLRRIAAGLRKFGGAHAEPFLVMLNGTTSKQCDQSVRSVNEPAPTVLTNPHLYLAEPFVVGAGGPAYAGKPRAIGDPLNTITTDPHQALVQPFVMQTDQTGGNGDYVRSPTDPLYTVVSKQNMAIVEPFISRFHGDHKDRTSGESRNHTIGEPLPNVDTANRYALVQPFVLHTTHHGERAVHNTDDPLPTVTGAHRGEMALIEPGLIGQQTDAAFRPVSEPCPTVATAGAIALVQPYIVKYYGSGENVTDIADPLATVTTRDRFMLVCPTTHRPIAELDILFRMLQPHELAAAQGFPPNYKFAGTREQRVKQIGNAVPVNLAQALCAALL